MKRCPTCNQQFTEAWLTFCPKDGTVLTDAEGVSRDSPPEIVPPEKTGEAKWSERPTPNLTRPAASAGSWAMPDDREPAQPVVWRAPPPPVFAKQPSQGLALASMITAIAGWVVGCFGPLPGIAALIMRMMALSQIKKSPESTGGKPFALAGVIVGGISLLLYAALIIIFIIMVLSR